MSHEETVAALVPLLEQETQPATVVGFSLGAQLAVLLAARRPDLVADAVVISAQAEPLRAVGPTLALLRLTAGLARNERFARLQARELFIPDALLPRYLETSAAISRTTLLRAVEENLRFTPPPAWRAHPGTALILVGAEEKPMMRRSAALLDRVHPRSTLEVAEGCGHGIPCNGRRSSPRVWRSAWPPDRCVTAQRSQVPFSWSVSSVTIAPSTSMSITAWSSTISIPVRVRPAGSWSATQTRRGSVIPSPRDPRTSPHDRDRCRRRRCSPPPE